MPPVSAAANCASPFTPLFALLTDAQIALLALLAQGMTVANAAGALDMRGSTPYVQLKNARNRLGCASNEEALRKARDLGLVG